MTSLDRRSRLVLISDISIAFMGLGAMVLVAMQGRHLDAAAAPISSPVAIGAIIVGLTLLLTFLTVRMAMLEKRCAEDYTFRLLSYGALVACMTTVLIFILWEFALGLWWGEPTAKGIFSVTMSSWAIGYFTYRIRGA